MKFHERVLRKMRSARRHDGAEADVGRGRPLDLDAIRHDPDPAKHLHLARWVAGLLAPLARHCDVDDLTQMALEAAVRFGPRYDPSRGTFSTYMVPCMVGCCLREMGASHGLTHFGSSRGNGTRFWRLRKAAAAGMSFDPAAVRDMLGMQFLDDAEAWRALAWSVGDCEALDERDVLPDPERFADLLDEAPEGPTEEALIDRDAEDEMERAGNRPLLRRAVAEVEAWNSKRHRDVILRRVLPDGEGPMLRELGAEMGLSGERVRGIEYQAIRQLNRALLLRFLGYRHEVAAEERAADERAAARRAAEARPKAPPTERLGRLLLRVFNRGCAVSLNRKPFQPGREWAGEASVELPPGDYWVTVEKDGHESHDEFVRVEPGRTTEIHARLQPLERALFAGRSR